MLAQLKKVVLLQRETKAEIQRKGLPIVEDKRK